jgi:plasmid maintenance system antidote protein VapI
MPNRIPSAELRYIRRRLFEGRFTASALASRVRMSANTFWVALHRENGITTDMARKIAHVLDEWSDNLRNTAIQFRALANLYDDLADQQEKSA